MRRHVEIPLRDGVRLSAILYLPPHHEQPSPVIFSMTPYVAQTHHERALDFATHGYPFLNVDVRGRGNSEGEFHPLNEARDGYDIVEWLAQQSYCNGKVAMCGGSYLGYCQWAAASQRPPHLATIVPVAAACYGVDFPVINNVFFPYATQWLTLVAGRTAQDAIFADRPFWRRTFLGAVEAGIPFKELDALVGNPSAIFQEWISHPQSDVYWDSYNPSPEQCANLSIPILTITGVHDADQRGALEHYRRHMKSASKEGRDQHYLIIGPWDHAGCGTPKAEFCGIKVGPASVLDLRLLHRQWYAWTMQGASKPEFLQERVAYYVIGADEWRYAESLDSVTARLEPLYLHSASNPADVFASGSLDVAPSTSEPDFYTYDPRDLSLAEVEIGIDPKNLVDQRLVNAAAGKHLVYHSAPFAEDTEISGFFRLTVWLAMDQPDTDFRARIYEVAIDGTVTQLADDWIRARYREGLRKMKLIETATPLRYDFTHFHFVSCLIRARHRLRLVIGPINSIHFQRNFNSGGIVSEESIRDARPVTVRLFHDPSHPSALFVPLGQPTRNAQSHAST